MWWMQRPILIISAFVSLLAFIVSLSSLTPAHAQKAEPGLRLEARPIPGSPRSLPGPGIHAVKVSPSPANRAYSATFRGLFVSDDGGQSWAPLPVNRSHEEVFSVAVHPTDPGVVVAGRRDGLWETQDGGRSWTPLPYPTPGPYVPLAVAISRSQPNVVYLATARDGVYKSIDGGYRWASASSGLPEARAGGRPTEIRTLVVHPVSPTIAYVATERHGVYRTTDGGASWHSFDDGLPSSLGGSMYPPRLAFDPDNPNQLYLVLGQRIHSHLVQNRLYVSSGGGRWLAMEAKLPDNTTIVGLTVDQASGALHFWAEDRVWELPQPRKP